MEGEQQLGLVDSDNDVEFREKFELLNNRWIDSEFDYQLAQKDQVIVPKFHRWFVEEKADVMASCMLRDVRAEARMRQKSDHFHTNIRESMNSTLKSQTNNKTSGLLWTKHFRRI